MQILTKTINFIPVLNRHQILLDLVTTGIHASLHNIASIAIIYQENKNTVQQIWLADTIEDEFSILSSFISFIDKLKITEIGIYHSFDARFMSTRCSHFSISIFEENKYSFINFSKFFSCFSLSRPLLEKQFGYLRFNTFSGKKVAKLAQSHLTCSSLTIKKLLITYIEEEIKSLIYYLEVRNIFLSLHKFSSSLTWEKEKLILHFTLPFIPLSCISTSIGNYSIYWKNDSNIGCLFTIPMYGIVKQYLYPAKDYFLILSQNQIVHKSIAQFITPKDKKRISQKNCFVQKESFYIPISPTDFIDIPIWYTKDNTSVAIISKPLSLSPSTFIIIFQSCFFYVKEKG